MVDYVFETSWEVCNKVGGIYTVLATRANTLVERFRERLLFIGPDLWRDAQCPYFVEDSSLLSSWREAAKDSGICVRIGHWTIEGHPRVILVDFSSYYEQKNSIYARMWEDYGVDSLRAYGDYDEACMFAYAAGCVVEHYYNYFLKDEKPSPRVVFHANEWMTGMALLYINKHVPQIGTVFTTHATSVGRSICFNGKPLYGELTHYNGDQMARELNIESKHSIEKQTAHVADCFTTVSKITARECAQLLEKHPNVLLPNGFCIEIVPNARGRKALRTASREALLHVASCLNGRSFTEDTLIVATSGRYEMHNKGFNLFLQAMSLLRQTPIKRDVIALLLVPAWIEGPRADLQCRMHSTERYHYPLPYPQLTHTLKNLPSDSIMHLCEHLDMWNKPTEKVHVLFLPCYLEGADGIVNTQYYDLLLASDLCVFPSYYEPWGYTPLEAAAFHIPCITTDLAGFGQWVNDIKKKRTTILDGVEVIHRTEDNFSEVAHHIKDTILSYSYLEEEEVRKIGYNANRIASKAQWKHFIHYYYEAYDLACRRASLRTRKDEDKRDNNK